MLAGRINHGGCNLMSNINMTIHSVKIIDLPAYQIAIVSYLLKKYGITEVSKYIREVVKNESR